MDGRRMIKAARDVLRVVRDDRYEQGAIADLAPDVLIPNVTAPKLTFVEPDLNAATSQCRRNPLGGLGVFRGVAQEHRPRRHGGRCRHG
jgi:hypothetical protein